MCLAKAFLEPTAEDAGSQPMMENVARVVVDGDRVRLTSILGQTEELTARIRSVDLVDGRLLLELIES
jgi:predicted RNA-binding protein